MPVSARRPQVSTAVLMTCRHDLRKMLDQRLEEKGQGAWLSSHEILGVVGEEFHELQHAVHDNNMQEVHNELLDIAVACIFGMACIREEKVHW